MSLFEKTTVIVNPISGGNTDKKKIVSKIIDSFPGNGGPIDVHYTSHRGEATKLAQHAVDKKVDLVIVVGGDGTVNEVGSALVNSEVALAIIPQGSGNGLSRSLKIPRNVDKACKLISEGVVSEIDVGRANERYFFILAGVGFDAVVGKKFDEYPKRGPLPYFYLGVKEYFRYHHEEVKIRFDNKTFEIKPFEIAVANSPQYGNNAIIAPRAKLNDGLLDICIVHRLTFLQLFTDLYKLFTGGLERFSEVDFYNSQTVWIERSAPNLINIDGEPVWEEAAVKISILPKALKIITPRDCPALLHEIDRDFYQIPSAR